MIDKGFLRIAITIMVVITITVVSVGVYLYFNFNSRSSLPVIAPKSTVSFFHFQTRQLRDNYRPGDLPYLDSFSQAVSNLSIFSDCKEPAEPGIGLYSDLVLFSTQKAEFIALSLTSESRFTEFLNKSEKAGLISKIENNENYNFAFVRNSDWLVAYKYKALVIVRPIDTLTLEEWDAELNAVFSGSSDGLIQREEIQKMYDQDAQIIAWSKDKNKIHGIKYEGKNVNWVGGESKQENEEFWGTFINNQLSGHSTESNFSIDKESVLNTLFKRWTEVIKENPLIQKENIVEND